MKALKLRDNAALDEAILMQADPIYLRRKLREMEQSIAYSVHTGDNKRRMPFITTISSMVKRNSWSFLYSVARRVQIYSIQDRQGRKQEGVPSKEYDSVLYMFEGILRMRFRELCSELTNHIGNSSAFRHHFRNNRQITDPEDAYRRDPLFWALVEIASQEIDVNRRASWRFGFIDEHLSNADSEEKARIHQALYDHLSDIAFVGEILTAIESHKYYSPLPPKSDMVKKIHDEIHSGTLSHTFLALLDSCVDDPEVFKTLRAFQRFSIPINISNRDKLTQNKKMHELCAKYWRTVHAKMLAHSSVIVKMDPDEKEWLVKKLDEYKGGSPHIFEVEQDAIRNAIRKEGKLHTSYISDVNANTRNSRENPDRMPERLQQSNPFR
jgi:hypothetical protein